MVPSKTPIAAVEEPTPTIGLRRLVQNFSLLTAGELTSKIFTFLAFAYLARVLGPISFGHVEFTIAAMVFLTLCVDLGSSPFGARELATDAGRLGRLLSSIITMRIVLAVVSYGLLVAALLLLPGVDPTRRTLLLLYGLTLFTVPGFVHWVFQGLDRMHWVALGSIVRQLVFAIAVFALIRQVSDLWRMGLVECLAVGAFVAFNLTVLLSRFGPIRIRVLPAETADTFRQSLPVGLSELTWASTWYVSTLLVGVLLEGDRVGWFGAAHRPVMTLHTFVWLYFYNLLPSLARCRGEAFDRLQHLLVGSMRIVGWAAIFIGLAGTLLAEPAIRTVFGEAYLPSVPAFRALVWVLPAALLSGHYRYTLIAYGQQKVEFYCSAIGAFFAVGLSLALIPRSGIVGAGIAILVSSIINLLAAYAFARHRIGPVALIGPLWRPLAAGVAATLLHLALSSHGPLAAGIAGCALYLAAAVLLQPELRRLPR